MGGWWYHSPKCELQKEKIGWGGKVSSLILNVVEFEMSMRYQSEVVYYVIEQGSLELRREIYAGVTEVSNSHGSRWNPQEKR